MTYIGFPIPLAKSLDTTSNFDLLQTVFIHISFKNSNILFCQKSVSRSKDKSWEGEILDIFFKKLSGGRLFVTKE